MRTIKCTNGTTFSINCELSDDEYDQLESDGLMVSPEEMASHDPESAFVTAQPLCDFLRWLGY